MDDAELLLRASDLPAIPQVQTVMLVNNFVATTVDFMNLFAATCEDKLTAVSRRLSGVELALGLLEAKLDSVPDVRDVTAPASSSQKTAAVASTAAPQDAAAPPPGPPPPPEAPADPAGDAPAPDEAPPPPPPEEAPAGPAMIPIRDHPTYRAYFRLQKIGVPDGQIKLKLSADGLDPGVIDDPEKLVEAPAE
mmetsp:Transcript_8935/g.36913  ORF Transcript_8935/g.36913 Transcript_8935/m.36913 type:complete len:193 (-) Transcript_8935:807-1385(-)